MRFLIGTRYHFRVKCPYIQYTNSNLRLSLFSKASLGGRVRDKAGKEQIAKQLGSLNDMAMVNIETGQIKSKKPKKEKTPSEQAVADLKTFEKKNLIPNLCSIYFYLLCEIPCSDQL